MRVPPKRSRNVSFGYSDKARQSGSSPPNARSIVRTWVTGSLGWRNPRGGPVTAIFQRRPTPRGRGPRRPKGRDLRRLAEVKPRGAVVALEAAVLLEHPHDLAGDAVEPDDVAGWQPRKACSRGTQTLTVRARRRTR